MLSRNRSRMSRAACMLQFKFIPSLLHECLTGRPSELYVSHYVLPVFGSWSNIQHGRCIPVYKSNTSNGCSPMKDDQLFGSRRREIGKSCYGGGVHPS